MNEFQESLNELLIEKGINYSQLAKGIGVSVDTISSYFVDGFYPVMSISIKLAKYFSCSMDFLFGLSEERNSEYNIDNHNAKTNFTNNLVKILNTQNKPIVLVMKDIGLAENAYYRWKRGVEPRMSNVVAIAKYLGVSIDYLLGNNDE